MDQLANIHFRILKTDEEEHSIAVRYWSDTVSEDSLALEFDRNDKNEIVIKRNSDGHPTRCRTDVNLTIYKENATEEDILNLIQNSAPVEWLKLKSRKPSQHLKSLHGHLGSFKHNPPKPLEQKELSEEEIDKIIKSAIKK